MAPVGPERSKKSKVDPREGRGFCVCGVSHSITRETCYRPGKSFEAQAGVCGNRLCGYLRCQLQYLDCRLFPGFRIVFVGRRSRFRPCRLCVQSRHADRRVWQKKSLRQCWLSCDFEAEQRVIRGSPDEFFLPHKLQNNVLQNHFTYCTTTVRNQEKL